jgi:hypothetical protein
MQWMRKGGAYLVSEEAVAGLNLFLEEVEACGGSSSEARHEGSEASSEHIHGDSAKEEEL